MKTMFLDKITGNLPNTSKPSGPRQYGASALLRIDAAQIQARGGPGIAAKLDRYFLAAAEPSPLMLAVMTENGSGIAEHVAANEQRIERVLADNELSQPDRREMAQFLAEMNHKLKNALLGRGELPVVWS